MFEYKDRILRILLQPNQTILDIGGADGPLGLGSVIVDKQKVDIWGNPVKHRSIADFEEVDVIYSSHMLEHLEDPEMVLEAWASKLKAGGYLILHVPSVFGFIYWHRTIKPEHKWVYMWQEGVSEAIYQESGIYSLKPVISALYSEYDRWYCGDCSLLVIGRK